MSLVTVVKTQKTIYSILLRLINTMIHNYGIILNT